MKCLERGANILYVFFVGIIFFIAVWEMMLQADLFVIILPLVGCLVYLYLKKKKRYFSDKTCKYIWYGASSIFLFLLIAVSFVCEVEPSWDWGCILQSAAEYVFDGKIERAEYYARYPNNLFCLICMTALFSVVKYIYPAAGFETFQDVSIVISCLFVWAAVWFIYFTAKRLWGLRRSVLAGLISVCGMPFYMYAQFLYTDTPGIFFMTLLLYLSVRLYQEKTLHKSAVWATLIGLLAGFIYHIKVIPFILFIAVIFVEIIKKRVLWEKLQILVLLLGCCIITQTAVEAYLYKAGSEIYGVTSQLRSELEYPLTHWVMMGLSKESEGGYYERDVTYTLSFHTMQERKKETRKVIEKRMSEFGVDGYLRFVFCTKLPRTWANSTFNGDDYINRKPKCKSSGLVQLLSNSGKYHLLCMLYTWNYYIALLFGMLLSGIFALRGKCMYNSFLVGRIALLGLVFFQILWECNSRYLFTFFPLMILIAMDGYFQWKARFHSVRHLAVKTD